MSDCLPANEELLFWIRHCLFVDSRHSRVDNFSHLYRKIIAFNEGERKPNFVFASCVFRVGVPVYGYAEFFEIAVRTPKWRPGLSFAGAYVGQKNWCELMTTSDLVFALEPSF